MGKYDKFGVKFGTQHSYNDLGLILNTFTISEPQPKTKYISVPFRDGDIDLSSSLTGNVVFNNRELTFQFTMFGAKADWETKETEIINSLQGESMNIVFDNDPAYFYVGRVWLDNFDESNPNHATITVKANVDPYKYDINSTLDKWEWDPFDFEEGYIPSPPEIEVDGEADYYIYGRRKVTFPTFRASAAMKVVFLNKEYDVPFGQTKMYNILIRQGENKLHFVGHGKVSIDYRGGEL